MKIILTITLLMTSLSSFAQSDTRRVPEIGKWHIGILAAYSNKLVRRGALTWTRPSLLVVPTVGYSNWFRVARGGGPSFYKTWGNFEAAVGMANFDDEAFYSIEERERNFRNSRKSTNEAFISTNYRSKSFEIDLTYRKDLKEHFGEITTLRFLFKPIPSFGLLKIGATHGFSELKHNTYMYGTGARSGKAFTEYNVNLLIPTFSLGFITIFNYSRSQVDLKENVHASLIRGDRYQDSFRVLFIKRFK